MGRGKGRGGGGGGVAGLLSSRFKSRWKFFGAKIGLIVLDAKKLPKSILAEI